MFSGIHLIVILVYLCQLKYLAAKMLNIMRTMYNQDVDLSELRSNKVSFYFEISYSRNAIECFLIFEL